MSLPRSPNYPKHASRSLHCKSYLVFNFLLQQFSPNLLHQHRNRKFATIPWQLDWSGGTNFIRDRFVPIKLQKSLDTIGGPGGLPGLISKCLFVFLPLDMCSGNINVLANNLRTRRLIVIYDNYMISFLQRGCFV